MGRDVTSARFLLSGERGELVRNYDGATAVVLLCGFFSQEPVVASCE